MDNTIHLAAPFYDLNLILAEDNLRPGRIDDVPCDLARAAHCAGPILEMACGTGRVTIPLAEAVQEVWAFDLSADMLRECHAKLARLPVEVQQRIHLMQADMGAFALARHFALIMAPEVSFQALICQRLPWAVPRIARIAVGCFARRRGRDGALGARRAGGIDGAIAGSAAVTYAHPHALGGQRTASGRHDVSAEELSLDTEV